MQHSTDNTTTLRRTTTLHRVHCGGGGGVTPARPSLPERGLPHRRLLSLVAAILPPVIILLLVGCPTATPRMDGSIPGVTITESDGTTTVTEGTTAETPGTSDTYTVVLNTPPTGPVVITVTNPDGGALTVDTDADTPGAQTTPLTFTTTTWNTPQTVTVRAISDTDADNESLEIEHTVTTPATPDYPTTLPIASVTVTVTDPNPGVRITPTDGTTTVIEGATAETPGASDTYTVVLNTQPTGPVVITVANGNNDALTVDTNTQEEGTQTTLSFTMSTWNTPQTVTVSAKNDTNTISESVTIGHTVTTPATPAYPTTLPIADVTVVVIDDDASAGVTISTATLTIPENAGTAFYTVRLDKAPTADVTVTPTSTTTVATVLGVPTFTTTNWSTPQRILVTGVNNNTDDTPPRTTTITHAVTSTDTNYPTTLSVPSITVTLTDDDTAAVTITQTGTPTPTTTVTEGATAGETGASDTYTLVLTTQPAGPVVITVTNSDDTSVTIDTDTDTPGVQTTPLTFMTENWNTHRPLP